MKIVYYLTSLVSSSSTKSISSLIKNYGGGGTFMSIQGLSRVYGGVYQYVESGNWDKNLWKVEMWGR